MSSVPSPPSKPRFAPVDAVSPQTWPGTLPPWFVWAAWVAMISGSVELVPHHHTAVRVVTGILMTVAAIALNGTDERHSRSLRTVAVVVCTAAGLATIVVAPQALGYVPIVISAGRWPYELSTLTGRVFLVVDSLAFSAAVGWASRSVTGALAGLAIPVLIQRAAERREVVAQRDRAQALLVEVQAGRDAEAHAAALRERGLIAREMHDVLAHSLAGLSLQLQAVRAVAAKESVSAAVTEPLDRAAQLARDGLIEARAAVGALRDPISLGPDQLPALVERYPGPATFAASGRPGAISPTAGHAVYRAVQEALTNSARYAPGSTVAVALVWSADQLRVTVVDDGPRAGHSAQTGAGSGLGLAGMQERLAPVGGSVQAGPRLDAPGWRLALTVPVEAT